MSAAPFYRWKQSGEFRSATNCERFRQQAFPRPARGADSSKFSGIVVLRTNYVQTVMDDHFNRFIAERRIRLLPSTTASRKNSMKAPLSWSPDGPKIA